MRCHSINRAAVGSLMMLAVAAALAGCASPRHELATDDISMTAPFSKTVPGSGDTVCWSVKRAMLSQGYMIEHASENGVLTATKDFQPKEKLNVTIRLQTTCADNRNGTSIVFATASREDSRLQKMKQTTSAGIGPATITMPAGSAKVLGVVRRATIVDPDFYNRFFALVENYVVDEHKSHPRERVVDARSNSADGDGNAPSGTR